MRRGRREGLPCGGGTRVRIEWFHGRFAATVAAAASPPGTARGATRRSATASERLQPDAPAEQRSTSPVSSSVTDHFSPTNPASSSRTVAWAQKIAGSGRCCSILSMPTGSTGPSGGRMPSSDHGGSGLEGGVEKRRVRRVPVEVERGRRFHARERLVPSSPDPTHAPEGWAVAGIRATRGLCVQRRGPSGATWRRRSSRSTLRSAGSGLRSRVARARATSSRRSRSQRGSRASRRPVVRCCTGRSSSPPAEARACGRTRDARRVRPRVPASVRVAVSAMAT